jgi:hypothetical protein
MQSSTVLLSFVCSDNADDSSRDSWTKATISVVCVLAFIIVIVSIYCFFRYRKFKQTTSSESRDQTITSSESRDQLIHFSGRRRNPILIYVSLKPSMMLTPDVTELITPVEHPAAFLTHSITHLIVRPVWELQPIYRKSHPFRMIDEAYFIDLGSTSPRHESAIFTRYLDMCTALCSHCSQLSYNTNNRVNRYTFSDTRRL